MNEEVTKILMALFAEEVPVLLPVVPVLELELELELEHAAKAAAIVSAMPMMLIFGSAFLRVIDAPFT